MKWKRTSTCIQDVCVLTRIGVGTSSTFSLKSNSALNMKPNRTKTKDKTSSHLSHQTPDQTSSQNMTNGSLSTLTTGETSDTDSASSNSERRLMNRSAIICSSGKVFLSIKFHHSKRLPTVSANSFSVKAV
jgi:hypothetical protein